MVEYTLHDTVICGYTIDSWPFSWPLLHKPKWDSTVLANKLNPETG